MRGWDVLVIIAYAADDCARPEELRCQDIRIFRNAGGPANAVYEFIGRRVRASRSSRCR